MEAKSRVVSLACFMLTITAAVCTENIDTREPILRTAPDAQVRGYFGYSLVLHQVGDASNREQALTNTR